MTVALPRVNHATRLPLGVRLCNWVGEVVLLIPTLQRLEQAGYDLHLVGRGWAGALLEGTGWPVYRRPGALLAARRTWRDLRRAVGTRRPAAMLFTKSLSSALETRLAGWRPIGYAHDGRSALLHRAYPRARGSHAAHQYWDLASLAMGESAPYPTAVSLTPSPRQQHLAATLRERHGLVDREYVLLCPFSGADDRDDRKVWPYHAELGERLHRQGIRTVVCPGPGEEKLAAARLPHATLLLGTDLGVYAALLASAHAVVANDTGPGHLAAAVGARLIALYGPQSVMAWSPLGAGVRLYADPGGWPSVETIEASVLSP
jgi:heptosyltransferase II